MENIEQSQIPRFSVSDFIASMNQTLEYAYPGVLVEGEVASFSINQGKFVFFDLKDDSGTLSCFMMVWQLRQPIQDGMRIVVSAQPKLTQKGKFSVTVQAVRPIGEGNIRKSFELLKHKLKQEGLFSPERKRKLPEAPKHIGVISSIKSAGYADFIKIINDRMGGIRIDVIHSLVQGESAANQIIKAIERFNQQESPPEVLVIVRGGGSADDLNVFNDEPLVRAVAGSRIPTLVGVGHETDETLVNYVADNCAATPSNAAQIVTLEKGEVIQSVNAMVLNVVPKVEVSLERLNAEAQGLLSGALDQVNNYFDETNREIEFFHRIIDGYNPQKVLDRGYAIVRGDLVIGTDITVETAKLYIKTEVKHVSKK